MQRQIYFLGVDNYTSLFRVVRFEGAWGAMLSAGDEFASSAKFEGQSSSAEFSTLLLCQHHACALASLHFPFCSARNRQCQRTASPSALAKAVALASKLQNESHFNSRALATCRIS